MPYLELHDHGWLALPAELRDRLDLRTGDRLQLELIEGGVRLRPAGRVATPAVAQPAPVQAIESQPPARRGPGRPRKPVQAELAVAEPEAERQLQPAVVQQEETAAPADSVGKPAMRALLPGLKVGGRRRSKPAGTT